MTRINVIHPEHLLDQHLFAEYRELPRIFGYARRALARGHVAIPARYTLGEGHMRFFYDKTAWLVQRHATIVAELLKRGRKLTQTEPLTPVEGYAPSDWRPSPADVVVNMERLRERLRSQKIGFYKYYGESVSPDFYDLPA